MLSKCPTWPHRFGGAAQAEGETQEAGPDVRGPGAEASGEGIPEAEPSGSDAESSPAGSRRLELPATSQYGETVAELYHFGCAKLAVPLY